MQSQIIKLILLHLWIYCVLVTGERMPKYLLPKKSDAVQTQAAQQVILRAVGAENANKFKIRVDSIGKFRSFQINKTASGEISIIGSDGISVTKAFQHYLKYYLHQDINWLRPTVNITGIDLPDINIDSHSFSEFIYYQNVCTWSYSFAWWEWSTWRKHIDWMALMGVSLTIAPVQEKIWYDVYEQLGLEQQEIEAHLAGPAFQAWQRMGNIRGWAGPLPSSYLNMQLALQKSIINAQRNLGMTVALPAFAGHVPVALKRLYPNASMVSVERWNNFPDVYCCPLFVEPHDNLFHMIGTLFLQRVIKAYGTNHIYFADPYNEVNPMHSSVSYLNMSATNIYKSMQSVDPQAIWLLQGWMFVKNIFWSDELIAAFLKAPPLGRLLILDLQSEQFPQYERTHSFHGQPFIWCMLHNFGGTLGMHGSADIVNTQIRTASQLTNSSLVGMGITPEGIHQNYVMYALALERAWSKRDLDLDTWFDNYAQARYGLSQSSSSLQASWQLLRHSVYAFYGLKRLRGKYVITRRPALNLNVWLWYNASDITEALHLMLEANTTITNDVAKFIYEHDLIDLTRQWLQLKADQLYVNIVEAYKLKQLNRLKVLSQQLLIVFDEMDQLLNANAQFLLGRWLANAKNLAVNPHEVQFYEFNARNQITTWGPNGQILDYANKQWAGLVLDYYKPRWLLFTDMLQRSLFEQKPFNASAFREEVSENIELPFSWQKKEYATKPRGNALKIARDIVTRWTQHYQQMDFAHNLLLDVKMIISVLT